MNERTMTREEASYLLFAIKHLQRDGTHITPAMADFYNEMVDGLALHITQLDGESHDTGRH